jgi:hypothetical protein
MIRIVVARLLVGLLVAGLAGLVFGIVVAVGIIASNDLVTKGGALGPVELGMLGFPLGIALFGVPFCAVVCLTQARYQPWKAAPRLLAGALAGFAAGLATLSLPLGEWYSFQDYRGPGVLPAIGVWIVLATLGVYAAACTIRKQPRDAEAKII